MKINGLAQKQNENNMFKVDYYNFYVFMIYFSLAIPKK